VIYVRKRFLVFGHLKVHLCNRTGERPFLCDLCKKSFTLSSYLKVHLRTLRSSHLYVIYVRTPFLVFGHLKVHLCNHTGERPFLCDIYKKTLFLLDI
jgi:KRAB domain-containing zinc finger protein